MWNHRAPIAVFSEQLNSEGLHQGNKSCALFAVCKTMSRAVKNYEHLRLDAFILAPWFQRLYKMRAS